MQSDFSDNKGAAFFSYRIAAPVALGLFVFLLVMALVRSDVITASDASFFEGLFSLVAFFGLYVVYKEMISYVRSVNFYQNHFRVSGWRFKKEFRHSQVDDLINVKGSIRGGSVAISVVGEEDPVIIPNNPTDRSLGADHCTWLKQKKESSE